MLEQVRSAAQDDLRQLGMLPAEAVYTFDRPAEQGQAGQALAPVLKTRQRTVVSLRFGAIRCREVLRRADRAGLRSPSGLDSFVGAGLRYAYDVIAHVGIAYYLHGHTLADIQQELRQRTPTVVVPTSSLYDLCGYFLYLFGQLHVQQAQRLRAVLAREGHSVWLLDCTQEADSPAFFGILETHYGILLGCWKMATENQSEIATCLRQAVQHFGKPGRLLHDLGAAITGSCAEVLADVSDGVCHFHLARDVGEDLFRQPHEALSKRLHALKLQMRLRGQRQDQVDYLRKQLARGEGVLLLQRLLTGAPVKACWTATLGREVLLAVHFWILDYAQDGKRQGYPFDPHLLYLHRRLVRAADALQRLFCGRVSQRCLPESLRNLCVRLQEYRDDAAIVEAAAWYEQAQEVFLQLRRTLRLTSAGKTPMSESYSMAVDEQRDVSREVKGFCERWRQETASCPARAAAARGRVDPPGAVREKALLRGRGATQRAVRPDDQRPGTELARAQEEMPWASRSRPGEEGHASAARGGALGGESGHCRVCGGRRGVLGGTATASGRDRQRRVVRLLEGAATAVSGRPVAARGLASTELPRSPAPGLSASAELNLAIPVPFYPNRISES